MAGRLSADVVSRCKIFAANRPSRGNMAMPTTYRMLRARWYLCRCVMLPKAAFAHRACASTVRSPHHAVGRAVFISRQVSHGGALRWLAEIPLKPFLQQGTNCAGLCSILVQDTCLPTRKNLYLVALSSLVRTRNGLQCHCRLLWLGRMFVLGFCQCASVELQHV